MTFRMSYVIMDYVHMEYNTSIKGNDFPYVLCYYGLCSYGVQYQHEDDFNPKMKVERLNWPIWKLRDKLDPPDKVEGPKCANKKLSIDAH